MMWMADHHLSIAIGSTDVSEYELSVSNMQKRNKLASALIRKDPAALACVDKRKISIDTDFSF